MSEILLLIGKTLTSFTVLYYLFIAIFGIIGCFIKKKTPVPYSETGAELRTFVENRSFQTVPKQEGAMNTLISGMGVPCTGTLRASVLSDS